MAVPGALTGLLADDLVKKTGCLYEQYFEFTAFMQDLPQSQGVNMNLSSQTTSSSLPDSLLLSGDMPDAERINHEQMAWWAAQTEADKCWLTAGLSSRAAAWKRVLACSQYARSLLLAKPGVQLFSGQSVLDAVLLESIDVCKNHDDYRKSLQYHFNLEDSAKTEPGLNRALRHWRAREQVRMIWRELNQLADTFSLMRELSAMADVAVEATVRWHFDALAKRFGGVPQTATGEALPLLVLGMGKLGANELNLSSDIDLIFTYPEAGAIAGSDDLSAQAFFTQLGQRVIQSLDARTAEGFVYRVDMRLRPYGQSGALVSHFDALETYYHTQGRDWERYAMIKARIVATTSNATAAHHQALMALLRAFTYRKYVDFSAIEALRDLKMRIRQEVKRRRLKGNVKLGEGGIREIEFIVQSQQLIRGGRDLGLQTPSLQAALAELVRLKALPEATGTALLAHYQLLRRAEHSIQAWQDQQTQDLPTCPKAQWALAYNLGCANAAECDALLSATFAAVSEVFASVISETSSPDVQPIDSAFQMIWWLASEAAMTESLLAGGFGSQLPEPAVECAAMANGLWRCRQDKAVIAVDKQGAERLGRLMPMILQRLSTRQAPAETLRRLAPFITRIARRSAYVLLLIESPVALEQLIVLSEACVWIPERLADHPALLDELLSPSNLYSIPSKSELASDLTQQMLRIPEADLEQQMEALRYFRQAHALKVAACEITGRLPLMKVSDYLTELAEVILAYALQWVWREMVARHGLPGGQSAPDPEFVIVGYGKLGGIELGHGSDLDLVFLHQSQTHLETQATADQKAIDNLTFYTRLGQKIIHLLNTRTASGLVYEVDMRLRPSGQSGLLVTTLAAFEKYQREQAWTWEHQALVRARPVAGYAPLAAAFDAVRLSVLCGERDGSSLKSDVVAMRHKMRAQLGSSAKAQAAGEFDLKQDSGGIVDIEFMVQYAILAYAHRNPALARYSDNIRLLSGLEHTGWLSAQEVAELIEAYKVFRATLHRLVLQQQPARILCPSLSDTANSELIQSAASQNSLAQLFGARQRVQALWHRLMEAADPGLTTKTTM